MMISLLHVEYLDSGQFSVDFSDGVHGTFDLSSYLLLTSRQIRRQKRLTTRMDTGRPDALLSDL
jgi:hypothetical protein